MKNKVTKVQKRNGEIVDFDQQKIAEAVFKAITATDQGDGIKSKRVSNKVVEILNRRFKKDEIPQVEQIQDIVEEVLILEGLVETARAYILYREQRRKIRETATIIDESSERIDSYLKEIDWQVNENANMTFSLQGLNQYVGSYISKKYWLNKIYPKEIREAAANEDFHIHNLEILATYTFFGREVIIVKKNNQIKLSSFKDIYEEIEQQEILLDEKDDAWAKYPEDLFVLDNNGWVRISRLVKKNKEREMRFIKSEHGRSIIVTDNHPFIIKRDDKKIEIESKDVKKSDLIFSPDIPYLLKNEGLFSKKYIYLAEELISKKHNEFFLEGFEWHDFVNKWGGSLKTAGTLSTSNSANSLNNKLELTEDLGYLIGIFITEGNYHGWRVEIKNTDKDIIEKIRMICAKIGIRSYFNKEEDKISLNCSTFKLALEKVFQIKKYSKNKNLPSDILTYNLDFVKGVIAGVIDGDGSITTGNGNKNGSQILIRVSSRTLLEQLSVLLQFLGITPRDRVSSEDIGKINVFRGKEIIQNYPIYGLVFSKKKNVDFPSFKYQRAMTAKKHWRAEEYGWNRVLENKFTTIADDMIFDITTESGTFLCNGLLVHNCAGWDLYDFLRKGFSGVSGKLESRPPKHFRTALGQLVNILFTLQGETAGANAVSNFDTLLAPFIRYDGLNYPQVKQAMQEFLYNCMVPTRVGFQTPFLNVTLDIKPPSFLAKQPVIIGGKAQKETYGEFQDEINMFIKAFYEGLMEGDAKGRPFTFPIPTVSITKDFEWDNPSLDLLWEATAKYGVNYFQNFIQSDMSPEDVRSMCLDPKEELIIRNSKRIKRMSLKEIVENYKISEFDNEGWADCKEEGNLEVLSLNPNNFKTEWSSVKRFLKVFDKEAVEITTEDGKMATFSKKHPIPVFTEKGILMKWSKDIKKGDYLLSIKKAQDNLSKNYQQIEDIIFNEDLAKILGYFIADGNYLFENRKGYKHYGEPRGLQFTFKTGDKENLEIIKSLIKKLFDLETKERQDPRYNTYYLYLYNSNLARKLYNSGFKKYGRLPQILFNSPPEVIKRFLEFHFRGDGYEKRKEIHINDLDLSRDLVLLYSLVGQPVTYKLRKKSQRIYLQHAKSKIKKANGWLNNPIISERIPAFLAKGENIPGFYKYRTIGFETIDKYSAFTKESQKLKNSDIYIVRAKSVKKRFYKESKEFFDLELTKNHLFLHSLGQVSFNCCRLRLNNKELYKRGGGLFGSAPLTGCYDEKTEILTENGWKFFKDLIKEENIFTLTENNKIELHRPQKLFQYNHEGEMYQFKTRSLDLLVTPNHRMAVDNRRKNKREFIEAKDFKPDTHWIPKQGIWEGREEEYFELPPIIIMGGTGPVSHFSEEEIGIIRKMKKEGKSIYRIAEKFNCNPVTVYNICTIVEYGNRERVRVRYEASALEIKMDDWLKFFGFWLAEGCTDNEKNALSHGYRTVITQVNQKKREEIKKVLDSLPFNYYLEGKNNFVICNKQLWTYLRQFGNKYEKFIPKEVKNLNSRQLKILFDWMIKGDGHIRKTTEQINYWTASKKLADGLQEIILKLGWLGTLTAQQKKVSRIKGKNIKAGIIYTIGVQKTKHYRLRKNNPQKVYYKGRVYCCEVENHTVFVRRNGKVSWCGNSIGVVTINMPRIGYLSKTKTEFFKRLGHLMDLAKESLEIKRKALDNFIGKGLYPYSKFYLDSVRKIRNSYFGNHFSTIGLMGMNEALLNFIGEDIASKRGKKFSLEVLDFMRAKLVDFQKETDYLYNLEATPGEGTSFRQAKADKEKYPDIITAGTKETPYYTNSSQLPVDYTDDIFKALKLQDELQCRYTGGCIEKGNNVLTDKGLIPIEDIVNNFSKLKPIKALSYNQKDKISEWDEILEAVKVNVKKHNKIRIKGERNLDIVTSDWHPFFVLKKFKPNPSCPICEEKVGNLKGFAVHIRWNSDCGEKYKEFPKYQVVEKRADELKPGDYILQNSFNLYPDKMSELDENLAWLIGFFVGDGCISKFTDNRGGNNLKKHKIRFFSEHQEALNKVAEILNSHFGAEVKIIQNDKRSKLLREVSSSKKEVLDFFFKYGFQAGEKTYNVSISQKVKENLTKNNIFSFLAGLIDSDGYINKDSGETEYYTVSSELAKDLLEIFTKAGIMISKKRKPTKRENEVDIWRLRIPSYEMTKLKNKLTNTFHLLRIKENLSDRKRRRFPVVRVKQVSKVNIKDNQFYDLMTKKNHNYLAGKNTLVFVHNTVLHLFLGEKINDPQMAKNLVKKIFEKFHLPYLTLTPTFSICPFHGYLTGEHFTCPKCTIEQPCEVYSRVVGYIRPVRQWHIGKKQEYKERAEFKMPK